MIVAGPVPTKEEEKEETELDSQFVFVQKVSDEEDEGEELRQSDIDVMNRVVLNSPRIQDGKRKRKVKMINLNWFVCSQESFLKTKNKKLTTRL